MFAAHVRCGEYRHERRGRGGFLYIWTAFGLLALHQAHHTGDFKSKFTRYLDGLNRGRARRADIVHDHDPRPLFSKSFDPLSRAVLLFGFADEKAMDIAAGHSYRDHNRVGSHGKPPMA